MQASWRFPSNSAKAVVDPLYGISFSHSTHHPHRVALSTLVTGATNKLIIVEPSNPQQSSYDPSTDFQQLTQSNLAFPATKVGWEPQQSLAGASHEEGGGRGELLATTGDVLRIWELGKNWNGEERGWTNVGRNGWSHGVRDYVLSARSVLTNVSCAIMDRELTYAEKQITPDGITTYHLVLLEPAIAKFYRDVLYRYDSYPMGHKHVPSIDTAHRT